MQNNNREPLIYMWKVRLLKEIKHQNTILIRLLNF